MILSSHKTKLSNVQLFFLQPFWEQPLSLPQLSVLDKPPKENVEDWCKLCFGRLNVHHCGDSAASRNYLTSANREQTFCSGGTPPLLTVVAHMDQVLCGGICYAQFTL